MDNVLKRTVNYLLIILVSIVWIFPTAWMVSLSFKPYEEWYGSNFIPNKFTLTNYQALFYPEEIFKTVMGRTALVASIINPLINSAIIVTVATFLAVVIGFITVYGAIRYKTMGVFSLFFTLMTRMLPPATFLAPIMVYYAFLHLLDTQLGLILLYSTVTVTYAIWLLKGFIEQIPPEWEEAAILEGASNWQVLRRVTIPLAKGGLVVSFFFIFIFNWTEFLFALVLTDVNAVTLTVQVGKYVGSIGQLFGIQAAIGILSSIPPVVMGYIIQRHLATGLTFGKVR
jgi:multiple sugar transport system permease protein